MTTEDPLAKKKYPSMILPRALKSNHCMARRGSGSGTAFGGAAVAGPGVEGTRGKGYVCVWGGGGAERERERERERGNSGKFVWWCGVVCMRS